MTVPSYGNNSQLGSIAAEEHNLAEKAPEDPAFFIHGMKFFNRRTEAVFRRSLRKIQFIFQMPDWRSTSLQPGRPRGFYRKAAGRGTHGTATFFEVAMRQVQCRLF